MECKCKCKCGLADKNSVECRFVIKEYLLFNDSTRCPDRPECCPNNSGNSVRMLPKYAASTIRDGSFS